MHKQASCLRWFGSIILLCFCITGYTLPTYTDAELVHYHDSGQYRKEVQVVVRHASHYISHRVHDNQHSPHPEKLAIVLDIDETSLSNYRHMHAHHFTHDVNVIRRCIIEANSPAIRATKALYHKAIAKGIDVFFITGRRKTKECAAAKENLIRAGYTQWTGLYCRPDTDHASTAQSYKTQQRQAIVAQGYKIIATIGDQDSDIQGGYAEKGFKLPNPFYLIA